MVIKLDEDTPERKLTAVENALVKNQGKTPVVIAARRNGDEYFIKSKRFSVAPNNKLLLKLKETVLEQFYFGDNASMTIGRGPDNDIVIPNLGVSGHHARIDQKAGGYLLTDLNSSNGTLVNNRKITTHLRAHGDRIKFIKHTLEFNYMKGEPRPSEDRS